MVDLEKVESIITQQMLISELESRISRLNNTIDQTEMLIEEDQGEDINNILLAEINMLHGEIHFLSDLLYRYKGKSNEQ